MSYENWVEYSRAETRGRQKQTTFRVSLTKSNGKSKPQVVFSIPQEVAAQADIKIGERFTVKWKSDFTTAALVRSKSGFMFSASGGKKGNTKKLMGLSARGSVKMTLDSELKNVFFPNSFEEYVPEVVSIGSGQIVFRLSNS